MQSKQSVYSGSNLKPLLQQILEWWPHQLCVTYILCVTEGMLCECCCSDWSYGYCCNCCQRETKRTAEGDV